MGIGGAPEGVLTAAALRCLNGEILARLVVSKPEHEERLAKMGIKDGKRVYRTEDLAPGKKIIFACTGVTDGNLLRGVRFFGEGIRNPVVGGHLGRAPGALRRYSDTRKAPGCESALRIDKSHSCRGLMP